MWSSNLLIACGVFALAFALIGLILGYAGFGEVIRGGLVSLTIGVILRFLIRAVQRSQQPK